MMKRLALPAVTLGAMLLSGCEGGLVPYKQGPDTVIATAYDTGRDPGILTDGNAAIAYDPDGCQGWILDDGVEGYSGRRFDPVSGLPICNNQYPPGTVVKDYQTQSPGLNDRVPRAIRR
ncbi:MAG: hypothetical protein ACRC14_10950 [Paracoccaceae bacterium]